MHMSQESERVLCKALKKKKLLKGDGTQRCGFMNSDNYFQLLILQDCLSVSALK